MRIEWGIKDIRFHVFKVLNDGGLFSQESNYQNKELNRFVESRPPRSTETSLFCLTPTQSVLIVSHVLTDAMKISGSVSFAPRMAIPCVTK